MRFFYLLIWCLAGFLLYLGGCSVRISAKELEASGSIQSPAGQSPTTVEVYYDKDHDKSGVDKAGPETSNPQ